MSLNFIKMGRRTVILLLIILGIVVRVKADTIDYWHVYHNDKKIKSYSDTTTIREIVLKTTNIKSIDSLTVKYFRDTPCFDCVTHLVAEDDKYITMSSGKGRGTSNPIKLSLYDLLKHHTRPEKKIWIYYYEEPTVEKRNRHLLFKIRFE